MTQPKTFKEYFIANTASDPSVTNYFILDEIDVDKIIIHNEYYLAEPDENVPRHPVVYIPNGHYEGQEVIISLPRIGNQSPSINAINLQHYASDVYWDGGAPVFFTPPGIFNAPSKYLFMNLDTRVVLYWDGKTWLIKLATQFIGPGDFLGAVRPVAQPL